MPKATTAKTTANSRPNAPPKKPSKLLTSGPTHSRYRDGGPGRRGRKPARVFQRAERRWAWVVGYVGSGGNRWRRSPCNCSAVAETSVWVT
jgi:hypothetical protein